MEQVFDSAPGVCAVGHPLTPGKVLVGWHPCTCPAAFNGGHRTWTCVACMEAGADAEATLYDTRHTPEADAQAPPKFTD